MLREYLSNLANQFRTHLDTTEPINAQDFADKIVEVYEKGKAEGVTEGKPLGKLELLQDSEYMNAKVSGNAISVNDVSPIEHSVGCSVASKNLLPYSRFNPTRTINGITFTNNGDGSITLNGTATAEAIFACIDETKFVSLKAGTYTLSGGLNSSIYLQGKVVEDDSFSVYNQNEKSTFTLNYDFSFRFNIRVTSGTVCENVVIKPQLELGSTATEYTPYVAELGGIEVSRLGKNLFGATYEDFINAENLGEGKQIFFTLKPNTSYTLSSNMYRNTDTSTNIWLNGTVGVTNGVWENKPSTTMTDNNGNLYILVRETKLEELFNNYWLQLEESTSATPYEPYIKPITYQSTADGTVEGVKSISPNMTLLSNKNNVIINANYLRDIDTYIDNLITNVALTGGE